MPKRQEKIKPVNKWAIYLPNGTMYLELGTHRDFFVGMFVFLHGGEKWSDFVKQGYKVVRVSVAPILRKKEKHGNS